MSRKLSTPRDVRREGLLLEGYFFSRNLEMFEVLFQPSTSRPHFTLPSLDLSSHTQAVLLLLDATVICSDHETDDYTLLVAQSRVDVPGDAC